MNLIEFISKFPMNESCEIHYANLRLERGIACKKCEKQTPHYFLTSVKKFQCKCCRSRTNLKAGTMMQDSNLPIRLWFLCLHLMTGVKKSFSALEMQRQLGVKRYEPVWYMMHKIRSTMGKRDARYQLSKDFEIDEAFFETVNFEYIKRKNDEPLKAGRGSQRQTKVLVMVESEKIVEGKKGKKDRKMGFVKMVVIDDLSSKTINYEVAKAAKPETTATGDDWKGYRKLDQVIKKVNQQVVPPKEAGKVLPWVHTMIANSKRMANGVHHSINTKYAQNYLNEFCYKINRRNFQSDLFDRALIAGADDVWF